MLYEVITLLMTTSLAIVGGTILKLFVPDGPFRKLSKRLDLSAFSRVFKNPNFRSAAFDKLRVTFTDLANNQTSIERNISLDATPPFFQSFSLTDTDGSALLFRITSYNVCYTKLLR